MKLFYLFLGLILVSFATKAQNPQDGWDFTYPNDQFTEDALLDLSYLNEDIAGENGFITLSADSNSFALGNGEPIRFWSVNGGSLAKNISNAELERYAKFLAKMGVNMIRYHEGLNPKSSGSDLDTPDMTEVQTIWRLVAAMKKEGIYTTISPYWPNFFDQISAEWGIDGYEGDTKPWAALFFNDNLKNAYKEWVRVLYDTPNSYTGVALKDEPAVALIQVQNEDGLFFWTIQAVQPPLEKLMMQKFHNWLVEKYGDIDQAQAAWGGNDHEKDNPAAGEMGIYIIWFATFEQTGAMDKRMSDQIEFFVDVQKNFYQEIYDHYRSLGCSQLINAGNWKTASANLLFDAERYTNTPCEVQAVNRYFDPVHIGDDNGWRINPGHHYQGPSALKNPHKLPINIKQVNGSPMLVTESAWNLPHKYQSEGPFLIAAYMSLTGVDSYYWFNPSSPTYDSSPYYSWTNYPNNGHAMYRWTISTPGQMAMFPANAFLFRKGYINQGDVVVHEERTLQSIYDRKMPLISEENSFDPNRDSYENVNVTEETLISPLAHLTGAVEVVYDGDPDSSKISAEIDNLIDYQNKTISSTNGQLFWDYENGICTMDAPSAQGATGFIGTKGTIELSDVTIETTNEYVTVNVVAMDEKTLGESEKVLIQIGTVYQPTDWSETPADFQTNDVTISGLRIDHTGKMPWKAANTEVTVKLKNSVVNSAVQLDAAGYAKKSVGVSSGAEELSIQLPSDAMYIMLQVSTSAAEPGKRENNLKVFPNPTNETIHWSSSVDYKNLKLEIMDFTGRKIITKKQIKTNQGSIDISGFSKGIYFVQLSEKNKVIGREKIIFQ